MEDCRVGRECGAAVFEEGETYEVVAGDDEFGLTFSGYFLISSAVYFYDASTSMQRGCDVQIAVGIEGHALGAAQAAIEDGCVAVRVDGVDGLVRRGLTVAVVDPRGVGRSRSKLSVPGHNYADPLVGVEENIAYNAFLVGKSLLGMRVTDVLAAVQLIRDHRKGRRVVLCARGDAALTACFAASVEPTIEKVATEDMLLSFRSIFDTAGSPVNAASILPGLLQRIGDIPQVLAEIAPRRILIAAGVGEFRNNPAVRVVPGRFSQDPQILTDWIGD